VCGSEGGNIFEEMVKDAGEGSSVELQSWVEAGAEEEGRRLE